MFDKLRIAVSFLTVLPIRPPGDPQAGGLGRSSVWFPLVGALLGCLLACGWLVLRLLFPEWLAAGLVVVLWAALTGGLHLDGLADCCDGLLSMTRPERRLEIMRDPRLGAFGGAGLALFLLIKVSALASIAPQRVLLALVLAPVLGRWLILLMAGQPMARPGGLGSEFARSSSWRCLLLAGLVPLGLVAMGGVRALMAAALAHMAAFAVLNLAKTRLGGITGDVMGLTVELGELAVLLVYAAYLPFLA